MNQQLTTRSGAHEGQEIVTRTLSLRAASADAKTRSVECVIATDAPVTVYDWQRDEVIDEVLVAGGGEFPQQIPLLDNHMRWSNEHVLGSAREFKQEGGQWIGRAYFVDGDEDVEKVWNKVRQGHIRDVSIGYVTSEYVDIPRGQRQIVNGKEYTAGRRTLRISTKWKARELSVTPIGADERAKIRANQTNNTNKTPAGTSPAQPIGVSMSPQLRKYLEKLGLRADATPEQATAFMAALGGTQATRAAQLEADPNSPEPAATAATVEPATAQRSAVTPITGVLASTATQPADPETVRAEAVRAERARVSGIRELAQLAGEGLDAELARRAESEDWTVERAAKEFHKAVGASRAPSVGAGGNVNGISSNHDRDCTRESLGIALAMRGGITDQKQIEQIVGRMNRDRAGTGAGQLNWQNLAQQAQRFDDMSLIDVCREAARLSGKNAGHGRDEVIRAAVSGGALTQIFTTSVNAALLMAYVQEEDTTDFVETVDVADFKTNTAVRFNVNGGLDKLGRGGTANHADTDDSGETYKIARYAKQFAVDEQDIIDDSMSAFSDVPRQMGEDAAKLRPDLVYAMILDNPAMADTGDVYNSTALTTAGGHANYAADATTAIGGPLAAGTLQLAITKMRLQAKGTGKNKKRYNIKPEVLVVPPELQFTAMILLQSAERVSGQDAGTFNPLQGILRLKVETRLSAGVTDPDSGTAQTGSTTGYYLFARAGSHIRVAYRRGTGRSPQLRSYTLDKGQWGVGFDINHDIGTKFIDFRGTFFGKGAA